MKINKFVSLLALYFLIFSGCEGSKFPLSDPSDSSIDERFIGSWGMLEPDEDGGASFLNIFAFNEHEYYVEGWDKGDEDEMMRLNAFSTEIDDVWFANIQCINCDEDESGYFFFKYNLNPQDELLVYGINEDFYDELKESESIRSVRSFIRKRMGDADFLEDEFARYRRLD